MKIELKNVYFSYEDTDVLSNFNLTINSGEFVALIGHNGSGKSTIAKLLMGLHEPQKGDIYFDDTKIDEKNLKSLRNKMSIIFQNPDNQFVGVTVRDDIAFGLENKQLPRDEIIKRIDKYIRLVGMEDYLDKNPEELSGGQKQRVAIAGALAMETDLIIFDESTSMLDPKGTKEVNDMIKQISNENNKTIIVITHDLEEVAIADRVIVLNKGKIVADSTPKEIFRKIDTLQNSGLKTMDSISIMADLRNKDYPNKKEIEAALWELTFKG